MFLIYTDWFNYFKTKTDVSAFSNNFEQLHVYEHGHLV